MEHETFWFIFFSLTVQHDKEFTILLIFSLVFWLVFYSFPFFLFSFFFPSFLALVLLWVFFLFYYYYYYYSFFFFFFYIRTAAKIKTELQNPKVAASTLFIKTWTVTPGQHYTFPGILARLRAMASSTAFSCLRSSSRLDRVLDLPPLAPAGPGSAALPGMLVTLLELLDCGESWRFLWERRTEGWVRIQSTPGGEMRPCFGKADGREAAWDVSSAPRPWWWPTGLCSWCGSWCGLCLCPRGADLVL